MDRRLISLALIVALAFATDLGRVGQRRSPALAPGSSEMTPPEDALPHPECAPARLPDDAADVASDDDGEGAAGVDEPRAIVEVRNEDGEVLSDARITVDGSDLGGGRGEIAARPGKETDVLIRGRFYAAERRIGLDPGVHTIVVPASARVAGRITVNGKSPPKSIRLRLKGPGWFAYADSETDVEGRFEFRGLPRDWAGTLELPREYRLDGHDERLEVTECPREFHRWWWDPTILPDRWDLPLARPEPALEVKLVDASAVRGRLLSSEGSAVYGGGRVDVTLGSRRSAFRFTTGWPEGAFCVNVPRGAERVTLEAFTLKGIGTRRIELMGPFDGVLDLGDIRLANTWGVRFRVQDESGQPVRDARAIVPGIPSSSMYGTSEDGLGWIEVDDTVSKLLIGKVGYRPVLAAFDPSSDAPIEVTLPANNLLEISVRLGFDLPTRSAIYARCGLAIRLVSDGPLFEALPHDTEWLFQRERGAHWLDDCDLGSGGLKSVEIIPDGEDRAVVVPGLRPGARVSIDLLARGSGHVLDHVAIVVGDGGEQKIVLDARAANRTLKGIVTTRAGDLAAGATVWTRTEAGAWIAGTQTDEHGRFTIDGLLDSSVTVQITREGSGDLSAPVTLASGATTRTFVLEPLAR